MNLQIDTYIEGLTKWKEETILMRSILLECGLDEELKWKQPCYSFQGTNITLISGFKNSCVMSFFKGVLLRDEKSLLESPGENSRSVKVARFTNVSEIEKIKDTLTQYIFEAIEIQKAGQKVEKLHSTTSEYSEELQAIFNSDPDYKISFENLTPGRKRGYQIFWDGAKQSATKTSRINSHRSRILKGYGIHDCTCGLSKKGKRCDGSHKQLVK